MAPPPTSSNSAPAPDAETSGHDDTAVESPSAVATPVAVRQAESLHDARRRRRRGLIAAAVAVVLLAALIVGQLTQQPASTTLARPAPTGPPSIPFAPISGQPVTAGVVAGPPLGLLAPREAVVLANGNIAVADEGNKRLVIADGSGHLLRAVRNGATALQDPYAVATNGNVVYLLDAGRGSIDRFDLDGRFQREILLNPTMLSDARGMSAARDGSLYVANPRTNTIIIVAPNGHMEKQLHTPNGPTQGQIDQPSDVVPGANGVFYVLDNQNKRIEALSATFGFVGQWPAPYSDTFHSVHLLSLPDGRIMASDPSGNLLLYPLGTGAPTSYPLRGQTGVLGHVEPLGLSFMSRNEILVTDGGGNRLLRVQIPA